MSEASSPAAPEQMPGQIEASLLPARDMRTPPAYVDGMVVRQESPDCLILMPTSRARLREMPRWLLVECFFVGLGLACLAPVYLIILLLEDDPSCAGRSWKEWGIEGWLAMAFLGGLMALCMEAAFGRATRPRGEQRSRWDRIGLIVMGVLMPVACLMVFAWRWDQSSVAIRLLGLPLCSVCLLFAFCAGTFFLFALVAPVAAVLMPFHIRCDRRSGGVFVCCPLDFPKAICKPESLVAVQVVCASEPAPMPPRPCQVNLALSDPDSPRVGLAEYSMLARAKEVGQALADFLCVPLVVSG